MNPFDAASPFDARYYFADPAFFARLHPYVSEVAQFRYLARVEAAVAHTLADDLGLIPPAVAEEIAAACNAVVPEEVYAEEARIQHNIRALVNCIRARVGESARPFVHLFATSADIMDTARALCLVEVTRDVLLPDLAALVRQLIEMARAHAETPQMGRTHGQHAVPITFGFAVAQYVSRIGQRTEVIARAARNLRGKFAGAVGAYNALRLAGTAPAEIEAALMRKLGLEPPEISTQVTQPEYVADYVYALTACWGVFANLADDFRHLQRSEIRELRDRKAADPNTPTVGSSTMPHKVNPKDFENIKSLWKAYVPRLLTVLMDQISEHQRDLTNSASMRFVTEFVAAFAYGIHRLRGALAAVEPDVARMHEVLESGKDPVAAEPLYIVLSMYDHPDAHEAVRVLARAVRAQGRPLAELARASDDLRPYLRRMPPRMLETVEDPAKYLGAAAQRTRAICDEWEKRLASRAP
jgi:adenylosuccinate lyase